MAITAQLSLSMHTGAIYPGQPLAFSASAQLHGGVQGSARRAPTPG